jgi:hypothetical protein
MLVRTRGAIGKPWETTLTLDVEADDDYTVLSCATELANDRGLEPMGIIAWKRVDAKPRKLDLGTELGKQFAALMGALKREEPAVSAEQSAKDARHYAAQADAWEASSIAACDQRDEAEAKCAELEARIAELAARLEGQS